MIVKIVLINFLLAVASRAGPVPKGRIVGGENAVDGQFPFMANVRSYPGLGWICGGVIYREHWVLTATHCLLYSTPATTRIVVGSVLYSGGIVHEVDRLVLHPDFVPGDYGADIAVVRVRNPFVWSRLVQPIRLGSEFFGGGLNAIALGWGLTTQNPDESGISYNLKFVNTRTITNAECFWRMGLTVVLPVHICAFAREGEGICFGDSGGPLVVGDAVVGVASWVVPCAIGWPDGFDRVSSFHSWILENSRD